MINRNNYEEYLLMYLDGELSPSDIKMVEAFLETNPDIKDECLLLQQTILQPETIEFPAKHTLYRKAEGISLINYHEYFLLYIDNELSLSEKQSVETFVLQNPKLQDEFTLLKQTVLPKEHIVFENKEILYRKEEKKRPIIISLRWASLAAAAMIGLIALIIFNTGNEPVEIAVQEPKNNENKVQVKEQLPLPVVNDKSSITYEQQINNSNKNVVRPLKQNEQALAPEQPAIAYEQKTNEVQTAVAVADPVSNINSVNNATGITTTEAGETKLTTTHVSEPETTNYTQQAVFTEEAGEDDDNNLYVGALQVNTDKVRGLFRKATRFLSNKVKNRDENAEDKVQIANLEVKKKI